MEYTSLGRLDWKVSVIALGAGGPSRLGRSNGKSVAEAHRVVRAALDAGINFVDTAAAYRTEEIVGRAVSEFGRSDVYISTKVQSQIDGNPLSAADLEERVTAGLKRLGTDYIDLLHLHGLRPEHYDYAIEELWPVLDRMRASGVIRAAGVTEGFGSDTGHRMLSRAATDDRWDAIMVGFNVLNQNARELVLQNTRPRGIGVMIMFAVRRALSRPDRLREVIADLVTKGEIPPGTLDPEDPLGFVLEDGVAASVTEAAYRFCRQEPGCDVIITGTGNADHLRENIESLLAGPLPANVQERLVQVFGGVTTATGN